MAEGIPAPRKIQLTKEKETLLMTLPAKALDARSPRPLLGDVTAAKWMADLDYDFDKLWGFGDEIIVVRARRIDSWARDFLVRHPDAVVLNLGCGLDTRYFRLAPPPNVLWFDLDYPDVLEVRRAFCAEAPGYRMLASSVTDPAWLEAVPRGRPTLVLAEGLLEYLEEAEVKNLLNRLTALGVGGEMVFDVMNSFAIRAGRKSLEEATGARHKWAVDHPGAVDRLDPRLRRLAAVSVFSAGMLRGLPLSRRLFFVALGVVPRLRGMMRVLRYAF